jgi:DeoR family transcriptional regulator, suf operon transcriptional repressor
MTSSTREKVLRTLLARPRITINDLAENIGINPISIRHHISSLQADGLVDSDEERHGVGRPRRVYYLTEAGVEKFPTRYVRLTIRLLEQLKEKMPPAMVNELFSEMAQELLSDHAPTTELTSLSLEQRLEIMADLLKKEGFTIKWERVGDEYLIHETSCPYYHIGQNHPEVCAVDKILISSVLSTPAEKTNCILNGDSFCTYVVPVNTDLEHEV